MALLESGHESNFALIHTAVHNISEVDESLDLCVDF